MSTEEDNLRATAYHEAAHAVLIVYFHHRVERATTARDLTGSPHVKPTSPEKISLEHSIIIAMAGAACIDAFNIPCFDEAGGGCGDFAKIHTALAELVPDIFDEPLEKLDETREQMFRSMETQTDRILRERAVREAITTLAGELLERKTLDGAAVHAIVEPILANISVRRHR